MLFMTVSDGLEYYIFGLKITKRHYIIDISDNSYLHISVYS